MEKSIIVRHTGGGGNEPQGRQDFWSKIPFFKNFSNSKFSVSNENKYYVGVKPQPTLNCVGRIWKRSIKDSSCHPELAAPLVADEKEAYKGGCSQSISGSCHRQKYATICTVSWKKVLDKVGWAFSPTMKLCWGRTLNLQKADSTPSKAAFTLAEVLITLGIIGVVAAMTLPVIVGEYQKQVTVVHLKKFYTTINQALRRSEVDNGEYKYWQIGYDIGASAYFDKYWKPYLRGVTICKTYLECNYTSNQPFSDINGTKAGAVLISETSRTTIKLPDGTVVINFTSMGGTADEEGNLVDDHISGALYVDINGGKGPNRYGKDVFVYIRNESGIINPYLINLKDISTRCNRQTGDGCAAKIMKDGWRIADDYPW